MRSTPMGVSFLVCVCSWQSATAHAQSAPPLDAAPASQAPVVAATSNAAEAPSANGPFELNPTSRFWAVRASAELGTLAVLYHTIQLSRTGSTIDYVRDGGQGNLSLFARVSAELELARRHNFVFLYQPIDLRTQVRLSRDLLINNVTFPRGSGVDMRYGFDFYRFSYAYDFFSDPRHELSVGLSLQIRNAVISFTSTDGANRVLNSNVGLVPALKARGRYTFRSGVFMGFEVDGIYANMPGLNGSDIPVEGLIVDGSLRAGVRLWGPTELFVNVRYLGGGSRGVGRDPIAPSDGYVDNWFHTMSVSLGANVR